MSDDNNDLKIHEAERCFVRKDFQKALHLANQVLQESSPTTRSISHRVKVLKTPCLSSNTKLSLGVDFRITTADRAGAIVLQSAKETSIVDGAMLEPFLNFYATSPMPLELLLIFINFLLTSEKQHTAIELAAEVVHYLHYSPCTTSTTEEIQQVKDELVWTLVTKLLPFCPYERYLENLSNDVSAKEWKPTPAQRPKWRNEPIRSLIPGLMDALESLHGVATNDCLERCREHLSTLNGDADNASKDCNTTRSMIPRQPRSSQQSWIHTWNQTGGYQIFARRVLNLLMNRIVAPLCRPSHNWETRSSCQAALTIVAIYMSWKQRRRIVTSWNILANLCLTPIREILDAALEQ